MNEIDRNQILKMLLTILLIFAIVGAATYLRKRGSVTLEEYGKKNMTLENNAPENTVSGNIASEGSASGNTASESSASGNTASEGSASGNIASKGSASGNTVSKKNAEGSVEPSQSPADVTASSLTGALLNGGADGRAMLEERITYVPASGSEATAPSSAANASDTTANSSRAAALDFYQEPLSENLRRYITGVSYPGGADTSELAIQLDELRYLHILHYNFEGTVEEGELICNQAIAGNLLDIFYELYRNEYQIERVRLIDEYDGDDTASMEDNNTSCFNYRVVEGSTSLSKHALGLAIDINPLYNPYITYDKQGGTHVSPENAAAYADRGMNFPYKIDENDLCYKLFIQHGFIWGGNWNSVKDYQHFQKTN